MVLFHRKFKRVFIAVTLIACLVFLRYRNDFRGILGVLETSVFKNPFADHQTKYFDRSSVPNPERSQWLPDGRVNAAFVSLARNEDLRDMVQSVQRLERRFNHKHHYPWVFLNDEEFNEEFMRRINETASGPVEFGVIPKEHWQMPETVDLQKMHDNWNKLKENDILYADSESYRHMCRFESGFFYRHPLVKKYEYYWRVEPSVDFWCDLDFDPFAYMKQNNKVYGFTITVTEYPETISTLWENTRNFLKQHPDTLHPNNSLNFISDNNGETYNNCHFWSNFEIARVDFWESDAYTKYFDHLDKSNGFFYERWGDAPVHSIAAALFTDRDSIHFFNEIGYWHPFSGHCPLDEPTLAKCECSPYDSIDHNGWSCLNKYYDAFKIPYPANWNLYRGG
ncbi:alpha-1,2-mannosyltransferase [Schizosaccharomyces octosporus yFS286]|uniref:Alpha-1,2-mannosyltransferase n=1 Tax=Schizosaccharomyces octosporus (strain yFS286) TaxID=483514 RepID=S9RJH0_SCHOY|nr:alpha-1,2-mannosyltransferase [Schizosaccharomyces octosporus yFS286]EPX74114.1 alpha-1,2-mannosyltransferase [Schizosaccharomyces octosporus yFS286]